MGKTRDINDRLFSLLQSSLKINLSNNHVRELVTGSSVAFLFKIIGMTLGYIFVLLITRNLGAYAMGVFAISITVLEVFSVFGRMGLETTLLRFTAEYSAQKRMDLIREIYRKAIKLIVPLCALLSVLMYLGAPVIAKDVFKNEHLIQSFRIISIALLPAVFLTINLESIRGLKKIKEYAFLQNIPGSLFGSLMLLTALLFYKSENLPILVHTASIFFLCIFSFILWQRNTMSNYTRRDISDTSIRFKTLLKTSLPMFLSSSLFMIMGWTDTIMLGIFRSEEEVGIYNVALKISLLTSITLYAINSIAAPKFAELFGRGDREGLGQIARNSTKMIFWSSLPLLTLFILFPSFVLGIFGNEFTAGALALIFLSIGQFVNAISGSVGYILQMTGKEKVFQYIILSATLINIFLNSILIPRYGINGAALASMISMTFWNLISLVYIKSFLNFVTLYLPGFRKLDKI